MKPDNNTVAIVALTLIVSIAILAGMDGAKEIALTIAGGIAGWMVKEKTT
jgi:hypothetical protein